MLDCRRQSNYLLKARWGMPRREVTVSLGLWRVSRSWMGMADPHSRHSLFSENRILFFQELHRDSLILKQCGLSLSSSHGMYQEWFKPSLVVSALLAMNWFNVKLDVSKVWLERPPFLSYADQALGFQGCCRLFPPPSAWKGMQRRGKPAGPREEA